MRELDAETACFCDRGTWGKQEREDERCEKKNAMAGWCGLGGSPESVCPFGSVVAPKGVPPPAEFCVFTVFTVFGVSTRVSRVRYHVFDAPCLSLYQQTMLKKSTPLPQADV